MSGAAPVESALSGTLAAPWEISIWGLSIGAVVGAAAFLSNFCALGAVADILFARDWRRMRAGLLAAGVAMLGTQALDSLGLIHIDRILRPDVLWLPALIGGLCFGFGMALAGGCINRALVRLGAGSLKSVVTVVVVGLTAAITANGVLAPLNATLTHWGSVDVMVAPEALHRLVAVVPAFDAEIVRWIITAGVAGGLVVFCLKDSWFRASRDQLIGGLVIGAMIPAAWYATDGTQALNFVGAAGDVLVGLTTRRVASDFGVASVVGVPLGAFVAAALTRNLALETYTDRADLPRNLIGATLMGFGGTLALGCTFGQGLSGLATLSITAMIAIAAILFGCLWGIRTFEAEGVWGGLKLTMRRGA